VQVRACDQRCAVRSKHRFLGAGIQPCPPIRRVRREQQRSRIVVALDTRGSACVYAGDERCIEKRVRGLCPC
jgi:hypothetical protein